LRLTREPPSTTRCFPCDRRAPIRATPYITVISRYRRPCCSSGRRSRPPGR
jgi:hypothetical protein